MIRIFALIVARVHLRAVGHLTRWHPSVPLAQAVFVLVGLGVNELSMNGPSIPLVKRVLRAAKASDARALAKRLLDLTTADDIEREVKAEMLKRFPGLLAADPTLGPAGG